MRTLCMHLKGILYVYRYSNTSTVTYYIKNKE